MLASEGKSHCTGKWIRPKVGRGPAHAHELRTAASSCHGALQSPSLEMLRWRELVLLKVGEGGVMACAGFFITSG